MKLLCPKCRAPVDYAYEARRCERCGWQTRARQYAPLRIPESDAVWVDPARAPSLLRPGYCEVRKRLSRGGPFLSCALSLSQFLQQLISFPVLIGGSVLPRPSPVLPLFPSLSLSGWIESMDLLLSRDEIHSQPLLEYLLFDTRAFARQAEARPFLSGGMFSLSYAPARKNLYALLEAGGQLLLGLSETYRKINPGPAPGPDGGLQFTLDGRSYPLQGARREGDTLFLLTHGLDGKTAGSSAVGEARCGVLPLPDFFTAKEEEEPVPPFAEIPPNPSLLHSVRRAMDGGFIKGRILMHTAVEMGTPGSPDPVRPGESPDSSVSPKPAASSNPAENPESEPLTIVYDARESRMDGAAALMKAVTCLCRPDAALFDALTGLLSDDLLTLLTRLRKTENRRVLLVVANADAYTDYTLPLERLLPETRLLPDGVVLVLHSSAPDFSFPADRNLALKRGDGDQSAFLYHYLYNHYPFRTITPQKRTEETAAVVAAARGRYPTVCLYAAYGGFRQRPRRTDLLSCERPEELFLPLARALYGEFLESAVQILSLCHTAALPCTPSGVMRLFPSLSPWLIRTVLSDLPLLTPYHLSLLTADAPDTRRALCGRYLSEAGEALSPRMLCNLFRTVAAFGTKEQKQSLKSGPAARLSDAAQSLSPKDAAVGRCLYETLLLSGETDAETQPAARALLSLYEREDGFSACFLARRLLGGEKSEPLTKRAAAVVCAALLSEQGADEKAFSLLEALPGGEAPEDSLLSFRVHALRGEILYRRKETSEALESLERALSFRPDSDPPDGAPAARAHDLCGAILLARGELEKALSHFTAAVGIWERLREDGVETKVTNRLTDSLIRAAGCQSSLGLDTEAMEGYCRAEALLTQAGNNDRALYTRLHQAKAGLYERNADTAHALEERVRAIDCHEALLDAGKETAEPLCRTLQAAAQDALNLGHSLRAVRYLDTALILTEKMTAAGQLHDPEWLGELRRQRAGAQAASDGGRESAGETGTAEHELPGERKPSGKRDGSVKPSKSGKGKESVLGELPDQAPAPEIPPEELRLRIRAASASLKDKQYAAAIDALLPLLDSLESLPPGEEAEALQTLAFAYVDAQRTEEGMPCLERLARRLKTVTVSDSLLDAQAHVFSSMGLVYRMRRKNENALESYTRAIELWRRGQERGRPIDDSRLASTYVNRAVLLSDRKQYGRAVEDLRQAVGLRESGEAADRSGLARLYLNLGYVYGQCGETENALSYNRKAIGLRDELYRQGEVSAAELARAYLNLGVLLGGDKRVDDEIQSYSAAIELLESPEEQTPEERGLLSKLYRYRAMSYQLLSLPEEQQADLRRADRLEALHRS